MIVDYLSVDFDVSPRIIWIDTTSSTSINVQNLIDTCMSLSAQATNMDDAILLESSGKEYLVADGSIKVGLTVTLNNAKIAFTSQGGPLWILCSIEGGNVVAVEDIYTSPRVYIPVIHPTAFISVERVSSSSATLSELSAIQYGSYNGGVTIDVINGVAGTAYNIGTPENPVNNLVDAVAIANERGFSKLFIKNSMTLDSGTDIENFNIYGSSRSQCEVIIDTGAICNNIGIQRCNISGVLDGDIRIRDCNVGNLTYVNGHIIESGLYGTITLDGSEDAILLDCGSLNVGVPPIIDMGGSGQNCLLQDYSGGIKFINMTGDNRIGIQIDGGRIYLDSTITSGFVGLNGLGQLIDDSTGTVVINTDGLISKDTMSEAVWDEPVGDHLIENTMGHEMYHQAFNDNVHIDTVNGLPGITYPLGTRETPVDNLIDALTIATTHNFQYLHIHGSLNISSGEDISGYTLIADRSLNNTVVISDGTTAETYFQDLTVSGTMNGSVRYTTCVLGTIVNFDGGAKNCLLTGNINITGAGANYFTDCDTYVIDPTYKQINVGDKLLNIIRCRGSWEITNYTGASAVTIDLVAGMVKIASSCVSGIITVAGLVNLTDESGAGCNVIDASLTETGAATAVADEDIIKSIDKKTKLIPGLM